ncbi:MAG: NUDIX domain-containing protein [Patescibacteria group bacterium]
MPKKASNSFEICARGIIIRGGKILLCKLKIKRNYFFPGGHVEFRERADSALKRELKEEIGVSVKKSQFIGTNENLYRQRRKILHEINIVFKVTLSKENLEVHEDHLEFKWVDIKDLAKTEVYPTAIRNAVLKWLNDKKPFWISQGFKK